MGLPPSAAFRHLRALAAKGFLETRAGDWRLPGAATVPVPILGRVPAGTPREPLEAPEGYVPCPADVARDPRAFALRVRGDSMRDAGILDGDVVVCVPAAEARDGETVVALVEGEATVKRFRRATGAGAALLPANPRYRPIPLRGEARLLGRVRAVLRVLP
jgi:repressor LexA